MESSNDGESIFVDVVVLFDIEVDMETGMAGALAERGRDCLG